MFGKVKLKARVKELEAKKDEVMSKNSGLYVENQSPKSEMAKLKSKITELESSLRIESEDGATYRKIAENLDEKLKNAVDFIRSKGYEISASTGAEISYSFSGESTAAANFKKQIKALNSKLIASEQFENDLKNKIAELHSEKEELSKENELLKDEATLRAQQVKKKPSKK